MMVVALALVCGLAAAVGIRAIRQQPAVAAVETRAVVYAAADIQRGETLKAEMLEVRQVPLDQVPANALDKEAEALERVAHMPMLKGDVIADAKLSPKGSGSGMAALIRPGMRAFTIQTPSFSSSLAGFLLPGNRVDVLLTMVTQGGPDDEMGGAATTLLLQDVEILAVHTTVNTPAANKMDPNEARSVTLLVTPEQASLLDLGQNKGTLHLSLRNPKDKGTSGTKPAMAADLQLPRPKKTRPVEAPPLPAPIVAAPAPAPAPAPAAPAAPTEIVLAARTLRGTVVGADRLTILYPAQATAANGPKPPAAPAPVAEAARIARSFP